MNNASVYPNIPVVKFEQVKDCIQSGDILLVSGNSALDKIIEKGTTSVWSHIGLLFNLYSSLIKRIMVMESLITYGVRSIPLDNYLYNYNGSGISFNGKLMIARYNNFPIMKLPAVITRAIDLLGCHYNTQDIAEIAMRIAIKHTIGVNMPGIVKNDKTYICSEYVSECYKAAGINIPYNSAGYIAPSDFINCTDIVPLFFIEN